MSLREMVLASTGTMVFNRRKCQQTHSNINNNGFLTFEIVLILLIVLILFLTSRYTSMKCSCLHFPVTVKVTLMRKTSVEIAEMEISVQILD